MKTLTNIDKAIFASQLKTVLESGLNISDGLLIISQDKNSSVAELSGKIYEEVVNGENFYDAVKRSEAFDDYFCSMVKIGELSGTSDVIMKELSSYYEKQEDLDKTISQAVGYPLLLVMMMDIIVAVLYFKVFPIFENVMNKAGMNTGGMMAVSKGFALLCMVVLSFVLISSIIYYVVLKTSGKKSINASLMEMIPFTRKMYNDVLLSKVTYALSLFVSSGYPAEEALNNVLGIIEGSKLSDKITKAIECVNNGETVYDAFDKCDVYSGLNMSFLSVGLKAGKQEETFKKLATIIEKESEEEIISFTSKVEPVMVGTLSLMVGLIIVSIMLPLITILSSIG